MVNRVLAAAPLKDATVHRLLIVKDRHNAETI